MTVLDPPTCAGRTAAAHDPAPMGRARDGWRCPTCGEHDLHRLSIERVQLGRQTYGQLRGAAGMRYGVKARCTCGWSTQVNQAPSSGGRREAEVRAEEHLAVRR